MDGGAECGAGILALAPCCSRRQNCGPVMNSSPWTIWPGVKSPSLFETRNFRGSGASVATANVASPVARTGRSFTSPWTARRSRGSVAGTGSRIHEQTQRSSKRRSVSFGGTANAGRPRTSRLRADVFREHAVVQPGDGGAHHLRVHAVGVRRRRYQDAGVERRDPLRAGRAPDDAAEPFAQRRSPSSPSWS